jgi:GTPase SAR1 family protein
VHVKLLEYTERAGGKQQYFVELWDVGAHWRYETLRRVFYRHVNGVVFVHEAASTRKSASLSK